MNSTRTVLGKYSHGGVKDQTDDMLIVYVPRMLKVLHQKARCSRQQILSERKAVVILVTMPMKGDRSRSTFLWRRMMLQILYKMALTIRLAAIAPGISIKDGLFQVNNVGQTARRRPKDPNMPGLGRLKKKELQELMETYSLEMHEGMTVEEMKTALYNVEPIWETPGSTDRR